MIYFYKVTDLKTGKVYQERTEYDEYDSYRDFIGFIEAMNHDWAGAYRYEESRESEEFKKTYKSNLTSEYEVV
jgi:hypothetical protein